MLRAGPSTDARGISQLVHGERFAVLDIAAGWAWGRCLHDDYVGYVPASALGPVAAPDHKVIAPLALVFADADIKAPLIGRLAIGAQVYGQLNGDFVRTDTGFIHRRHLQVIDAVEPDPVVVAERLIGMPYLWGGRGADGIDCSGLVQRALGLAGIEAPRDSDQQRDGLGRALADDEALVRGDLVFFPGHVGLMVDAERLIHANAFWMAVTVEPLADVVARLAPTHASPISARRRIG
ncbi:C40 family peptidase [Sphingomonas sp. MMS24-J13]|uniref:C40 family peptidase n=1 Tax=Sphingomonas sp. MMS24-J13 TaxID=3238686 RepID=UPI00384FA233